jgi:hypothetical protein
MPDRRVVLRQYSLQLAAVLLALACSSWCSAQQDGGGGLIPGYDGGGQEVLQSLFVPYVPNAPFSLKLAAEWVRPMANGGTFTTVNSRPIMRDSKGRIYQERWLMTPKGSGIVSRMSWIQIADPAAKTLYQCNAVQKVCMLVGLADNVDLRVDPSKSASSDLKDREGQVRGKRVHEDLGETYSADVRVHEYRDTTTMNPGALGNDLPLVSTRRYRFAPQLGFNLYSEVEAPQLGKQTFTVTEISTAEPDARWFEPPEGYRVVDKRKSTE